MKTKILRSIQLSVLGVLFLSPFIFIFSDKTESQEAAATYEIDAVHSSVLFRAKHKGVAYNYGRFNDFSGKITMR